MKGPEKGRRGAQPKRDGNFPWDMTLFLGYRCHLARFLSRETNPILSPTAREMARNAGEASGVLRTPDHDKPLVVQTNPKRGRGFQGVGELAEEWDRVRGFPSR